MAIFAPIHIKSGYSFLQSGLTIDKIVSSLKKNDYYGAALADFNCLFGVHEFADVLAKINKPYCIGMEVSLGEDNITLFVKSEEGYRNLLKINSSIQHETFNLDVLRNNAAGLIAVVESKYGTFKDMVFIDNDRVIWVRSDRKISTRPCEEYKKMKERYCLACKHRNPSRKEICFEYDESKKQWICNTGERCVCRP